jgi:hypothetical protein
MSTKKIEKLFFKKNINFITVQQPKNFKAHLSHTDPTPKPELPPPGCFACNNQHKHDTDGEGHVRHAN